MPRYDPSSQDPGRDVRVILDLLEHDLAATGECHAPMDVVETASGLEIVVDLPGVRVEDLVVAFLGGSVVVTARKTPAGCEHREAAFHLAERGFGLCARTIRLEGAFDAGRAHATLSAGELRVVVPRIDERRGREIRIPVRAS